MAGQVKHAKLFSSIRPDWKLVKLLMSLPARNTDGLIGGVVKVLEEEGIRLRDSTALLEPLLATKARSRAARLTPMSKAISPTGARIANARLEIRTCYIEPGQRVAMRRP